ncbi:hypothetical protein Sjap_011327 [Stephania japonica]|uniref:Uncharacterized protein n=1 Tax=Stephania japonica TaxID=461633 RepID=A0AAP0P7B3_9MAGN
MRKKAIFFNDGVDDIAGSQRWRMAEGWHRRRFKQLEYVRWYASTTGCGCHDGMEGIAAATGDWAFGVKMANEVLQHLTIFGSTAQSGVPYIRWQLISSCKESGKRWFIKVQCDDNNETFLTRDKNSKN